MFKFRKQTNTQAKRNSKPTAPTGLQWRKSWNWGFLLLPILATGVYLVQLEEVMPVRSIQLMGTFENLDQNEVEIVLHEYVGQGFFSLDIHQLQRSIKEQPWTESVSVRRIWPDKVRVVVHERRPVARWDAQHLMSDSARIYRADTSDFAHLPLVHAENHEADWALREFRRLQSRFDSVDERVVALRVDSRVDTVRLELEIEVNGQQYSIRRDFEEDKIEVWNGDGREGSQRSRRPGQRRRLVPRRDRRHGAAGSGRDSPRPRGADDHARGRARGDRRGRTLSRRDERGRARCHRRLSTYLKDRPRCSRAFDRSRR